ncbi:MAG TPA: NAD(P)-dependent oxidoreductase [Gammaproteobacteria bacterium]|nr:NAD(P)-dependent oxidoreductase [Gammaproteobacteria bacterium]
MRILVYLEHDIPAFIPGDRQLARLGERLAGHELVVCREQTALLRELPSAEGALVWRFQPEWYARAPRLQWISTPAAGRELVAADPQGRVPRIFGRYHGRIMAESLLAMIGFVNRRFGHALEAQRMRVWDRNAYADTRRLAEQTVLLVGYGHIGQHCAKLLKAVGATVYGLKRHVGTGTEGADRIFAGHELLEAVALADHVVCVLPSDTGTDALLGSAAFEHMRSSAAVYNLGRGNAIDATALREALYAGRIAAAFLDVLPEEPLPPESPLWETPNLFLTPHVSALTADYLDLYFDEVVARLGTGSGGA